MRSMESCREEKMKTKGAAIYFDPLRQEKVKLNHQRQFTSLIDCMKQTTKKDGLLGLYKGFTISIIGITAYRSVYFGVFDTGKDYLFQNMQKANFFAVWSFA